jgi:hypothetical protein
MMSILYPDICYVLLVSYPDSIISLIEYGIRSVISTLNLLVWSKS